MSIPTYPILIVEDDADCAGALRRALSNQYKADLAFRGTSGLRKAMQEPYSAILLDLHLPDMPGLVFCQKYREFNIHTPVMIITGDSDVNHKICAFEAGADDYVLKPFSIDEIKARIKAAMRRNINASTAKLNYGDICLDPDNREVSRCGQSIRLRRKEFDILACLMHRSGNVVCRDSIINYAWSGDDSVWSNAIDVHIKYLRDKVDKPFDSPMIKTVRGIGYKLEI